MPRINDPLLVSMFPKVAKVLANSTATSHPNLARIIVNQRSRRDDSRIQKVRVLRLHSHSTFYNMSFITIVRNQRNQMVDRISAYF